MYGMSAIFHQCGHTVVSISLWQWHLAPVEFHFGQGGKLHVESRSARTQRIFGYRVSIVLRPLVVSHHLCQCGGDAACVAFLSVGCCRAEVVVWGYLVPFRLQQGSYGSVHLHLVHCISGSSSVLLVHHAYLVRIVIQPCLHGSRHLVGIVSALSGVAQYGIRPVISGNNHESVVVRSIEYIVVGILAVGFSESFGFQRQVILNSFPLLYEECGSPLFGFVLCYLLGRYG